MQHPSYQLFVCRGVTCTSLFADDVVRELRKQVQKRGLSAAVEIQRGGCYDRCGGGVTVVVRVPSGSADVVYPEVMEPEVRRIVVEHLQGGTPVAEMIESRRGAKPAAGCRS
jgi:(2Fe-2S) ferredoxin